MPCLLERTILVLVIVIGYGNPACYKQVLEDVLCRIAGVGLRCASGPTQPGGFGPADAKFMLR